MGKLEENARRKVRYSNLQKIILEIVADTGILAISLVAPNVVKVMKKLGVIPKRRQAEYTRSSASKLVDRGLLVFDEGRYKLTSQGEKILRRWQFADFKLQNPKKWDKKWRVMIFDIPEKLKKIRNHLTLLLHEAGFIRLQDSVWVYPYDCEDMITLLKTDFGIGKYLLYLIVDEIENDKHLRKGFNLM